VAVPTEGYLTEQAASQLGSEERVVGVETGDGEVPSSDVWEAYLDYCEVEGIPTRDRQQEVTKELKKLGFNTGRAYINGTRRRIVSGAEFSPRGEKHRDAEFEPEDGDQSGLYNF